MASFLLAWILLPLGSLTLVACHDQSSEAVDPSYEAEILQWRQSRLERLEAPDGWLSLVGLCWLEEGENWMGRDPEYAVPLPSAEIPEKVGAIRLSEGSVTFFPAEGAEISLGGKPLTEAVKLKTDADQEGPDILQIGRIRAYVIKRGNQFAIRLKNPEAPTRIRFRGLNYFPIDPAFRVRATLKPYPAPKDVSISTAVGIDQHMLCPGVLRFTIKGKKLELQPWIDKVGQRELFIVFRDKTSGTESYGAGRFLSARLNEDLSVVLDFNKAFSPPCAFTAYATCPLAPPENDLPIAIRAGEQLVHGGGH